MLLLVQINLTYPQFRQYSQAKTPKAIIHVDKNGVIAKAARVISLPASFFKYP